MRNHKLLLLAAIVASLGAAGCGEVMAPGDPGNLVARTVAEDPTLPAIDLNGSRFHIQAFGNPANPTVVFLHGGPGGDYRSLLRLTNLADDYFLVFWDQRGTGLSKRHDSAELTIDLYVQDLNALIDRFSPNKPVYLVGHSWGGMYATRYINQYPRRVAGAVLIEPGPLDGVTMERIKGDLRDFQLGSELLNDIAWNTQFFTPDDHARMDYEMLLGLRDGQSKFHQSKTDPEPGWRPGAAASKYLMKDGQDQNGKFDYDFTDKLSAFTTPVLFMAGAQSEVLGPSLQRDQVKRYPSATLAVVNDVGHDLPWVKATEVTTLIRAYLDARKGDR